MSKTNMSKTNISNKGYIHIYTGNGKGKTTAAFGLALRAALAGKKVFIGQFVKSMKYNETKITQYLPNIEIEQFGRGCFIEGTPEKEDVECAKKGLSRCADILKGDEFDLVILDEILIAIYCQLFSTEDVLKLLQDQQPHIEVVLTGRYAPQELIDVADLVTDMQEVKHYYEQGVLSREGIDF